MTQQMMINNILEWERKLEIEDENRKHQRYEPYVNNYLAAPQDCRKNRAKARGLLFAWILALVKRQPKPVVPQITRAAQRSTHVALQSTYRNLAQEKAAFQQASGRREAQPGCGC